MHAETSLYIYIAVRETSVTRHNGGPIEDPVKPPVHYKTKKSAPLRYFDACFIHNIRGVSDKR